MTMSRRCVSKVLWLLLLLVFAVPVLAQTPSPSPSLVEPSATPEARPSPRPSALPEASATPGTSPTPVLVKPLIPNGSTDPIHSPETFPGDGSETEAVVQDRTNLQLVRNRLASLLGKPSLFKLADTSKFSSERREASLRSRLKKVVNRQGEKAEQVVIDASYGPYVLRTESTVLVTVLEQDMPTYYSSQMSPKVKRQLEKRVARKWERILQGELVIAATMRGNAYHRFALAFVALLILVAVLLHKLINHIGFRYIHTPLWSLKILLWTIVITVSFGLFIESHSLAWWVNERILVPISLFWTVVASGGVIGYLGQKFLRHQLRTLLRYRQEEEDGRFHLRVETYLGASSIVLRMLLIVVGGVVYLSLLGFDIGSSIASMGALGVVAGYIAQDAIKNAFTGWLVLTEDRYGIGDWVDTAEYGGEVERFSLFSTQLRDIQGSVVSIPNTKMEPVKNSSKLWSQVDYRVGVSYSADLDRSLEILLEVASELAKERGLETPTVLGVQELGDNGITLRLQLRTGPGEHWSVGRELNLRVKKRFDLEGIEIPFPQLTVWNQNSPATQNELSDTEQPE